LIQQEILSILSLRAGLHMQRTYLMIFKILAINILVVP